MGIDYLKKEYDKKLAIIEGKFYVMAKTWFAKGRKEFSDAIQKQRIPNWNIRFDELWKEFYSIDLKCPECGNIITLKLDVDKTFDIKEIMNTFINLMCQPCGRFIDIDKWEVIKNGS